MKIVKALTALKMARSGSEATRMVKEGSVWVGGCTPPCNPRRCCGDHARLHPGQLCPLPIFLQYKCHCNGWRKANNPTEDVPAGTVLRVKDGSLRLLVRDGAVKSSGTVYDSIQGIGWVPEEVKAKLETEVISVHQKSS
jgi:hypothetical protein